MLVQTHASLHGLFILRDEGYGKNKTSQVQVKFQAATHTYVL